MAAIVKTYHVEKQVGKTASYRLYLAKDTLSGERYLLQVAASREFNGGLDRAAFLLTRFKSSADTYDIEYAKTHERKHLHFDRLYPELMESFISSEYDDKRINVLSITDVEDVLGIVPLSSLRKKDQQRVDPETSAWIMGRVLKMLTFIHGEGVANRALAPNNILIDPEQHFAVTLDWSKARMFLGQVPHEHAATDIADAATAVFGAIGGDTATETWPYEGHERYVSLLRTFMRGNESSAMHAHDQFYTLVRAEYGREFHPFTTLPL